MTKKKGTDKLLSEAYDEIVEYVLRICQGKYNFDYQMAKKTIYANGKHNFAHAFDHLDPPWGVIKNKIPKYSLHDVNCIQSLKATQRGGRTSGTPAQSWQAIHVRLH